MDLGMRTGTGGAAFKAFARIGLWLVGMIVVGAMIGLQWSTLAFAFLFGFVNVKWTGPARLWALVPGIIVALVVFGVLDQVMHVVWPDRVITDWLLGR